MWQVKFSVIVFLRLMRVRVAERIGSTFTLTPS